MSDRYGRGVGRKAKEVVNESRRRVAYQEIHPAHPLEPGDVGHRDLFSGHQSTPARRTARSMMESPPPRKAIRRPSNSSTVPLGTNTRLGVISVGPEIPR